MGIVRILELPLLSISAALVTFYGLRYMLARRKYMVQAEPNERSAHKIAKPSSGGIIFFPIVFFSFVISGVYTWENTVVIALLCGFTILGYYDDKLDLSAKFKFIFQFSAATVCYALGMNLDPILELMGWHEIHWFFSGTITVLFFVGLINAFNLIDGVDGLAGGIATLTFLIFGLIAFKNQDLLMMEVCALSVGQLLGFLRFNFAPSKLFMGDSGSLYLGCLISILFMRSIKIADPTDFGFLFAVVYLPVLDMARLFVQRLLKGFSPFKADKNHIHHLLLKHNANHMIAAVKCYSLVVFFLLLGFLTSELGALRQVLTIIVAGSLIYAFNELNFLYSTFKKSTEISRKVDQLVEQNRLMESIK